MEAFFDLLKWAMVLGLVVGLTWHATCRWQVHLAATRMGLRDKGEVEDDGYTTRTHYFCNTGMRVGIGTEGAVLYCWRCEVVVEGGNHTHVPKALPAPPARGLRPYLRYSNPNKLDGSVWPPPGAPPSAA